MESFDSLREQSNQAGVEFLFLEIETAQTFLQLAATTRVPETRHRNTANAHLAYDTILHYQQRITLAPEDEERFNEGVAELKQALQDLGVTL